jgi:hypothetical protein
VAGQPAVVVAGDRPGEVDEVDEGLEVVAGLVTAGVAEPEDLAGFGVARWVGVADWEGVVDGLGRGERDGLGAGVDVAGTGMDVLGVGCGAATEAGAGRTRMYSAYTARNATVSTMVEVRGRRVSRRRRPGGR